MLKNNSVSWRLLIGLFLLLGFTTCSKQVITPVSTAELQAMLRYDLRPEPVSKPVEMGYLRQPQKLQYMSYGYLKSKSLDKTSGLFGETVFPVDIERLFSTFWQADKKKHEYTVTIADLIEIAVSPPGIFPKKDKMIPGFGPLTFTGIRDEKNPYWVRLGVVENGLFCEEHSQNNQLALPWTSGRGLIGETIVFPSLPKGSIVPGDVWQDQWTLLNPNCRKPEELFDKDIVGPLRALKFAGTFSINGKAYGLITSYSKASQGGGDTLIKLEGAHLFDLQNQVFALSMVKLDIQREGSNFGSQGMLIHWLQQIGGEPYDLIKAPQLSDNIAVARLVMDFSRQWRAGLYGDIEKYFNLQQTSCGPGKISNVLKEISTDGISLESDAVISAQPIDSLNSMQVALPIDVAPDMIGDLLLTLKKTDGRYMIEDLNIERLMCKHYKINKAACGSVIPDNCRIPTSPITAPVSESPDEASPTLTRSHMPKNCPKNKSCYSILAGSGRILAVKWDKQTAVLEDRTYKCSLHFTVDGEIRFDLMLPDGVIISAETNETGNFDAIGIPSGECSLLIR